MAACVGMLKALLGACSHRALREAGTSENLRGERRRGRKGNLSPCWGTAKIGLVWVECEQDELLTYVGPCTSTALRTVCPLSMARLLGAAYVYMSYVIPSQWCRWSRRELRKEGGDCELSDVRSCRSRVRGTVRGFYLTERFGYDVLGHAKLTLWVQSPSMTMRLEG